MQNLSIQIRNRVPIVPLPEGRTVSFQMGFKVMGTIGILMAAYEENELTADEMRKCVEGLQNAGRHISQKHYQMLIDRIRN